MIFTGNNNEYLNLQEVSAQNCSVLKEKIESALTLVWINDGETILEVDNVKHILKEGQVVFLTEFHRLKVLKINQAKMVRFNRPFYCILDHDDEVSCKGLLFFGASQLPVITIPDDQEEKFATLWKFFEQEMSSKDELQLSMLQMMLKRLLILCTRLYKEQNQMISLEQSGQDLIREFNFLVEKHFRSMHTVSDYADLLHKSPKTISNLFAKMGARKPLQYIQDRIKLEARRLLKHSDKPVTEIAYELGYEDIHAFSRFFKKQEGVSPSKFREKSS